MNKSAYESIDLSNFAADAVSRGLAEAFRVHEELGDEGLETVRANQFGDVVLRGDVEAEDAVLRAIRHLNAKIISEEHGVVELNSSKGPRLTGVLDGIDGSSVYKNERGAGNYGTMFALFEGENPAYGDYLSAGIMQHSVGKLILAVRDRGLKIVDIRTGDSASVRTKRARYIQPTGTKIYVDSPPSINRYTLLRDYFNINKTTFADPLKAAGYKVSWLGASAAYYAAVAIGEADIVGESTRKGNLEIATAYGLVKEAGGVMVTLDGKDLGGRKLLDFGQNEHIPILTASNSEVARDVLDLITRH